MAFFDLQIPFFLPVWRRVVVIAVCAGWAVFEFFNGQQGWGMLFLGLAALAAYQMFFAGWPKQKQAEYSADQSASRFDKNAETEDSATDNNTTDDKTTDDKTK